MDRRVNLIEKKSNFNPFVSVIIPVLNNLEGLKRCLHALEQQTYPKHLYECIVVDNGSTESYEDILHQFPHAVFTREKRRSAYAARNKGVTLAKGEILAFTDSDCVPTEKWIEKAVPAFADSKVGCVAGQIEGYPHVHTKVQKYLNEIRLLDQRTNLNNFFLPFAVTANVFYRRDIFDRIGMFRNTFGVAGDMDFSWKMQLETSHKIPFVEHALVFHVHRESIWDLFRQMEGWGAGMALIENKYKSLMKKSGRFEKRPYQQYPRHVIDQFNRMIKAIISKHILMRNKDKSDSDKAFSHLLQWVMPLGFCLGMIKERIRLKLLVLFQSHTVEE